MKKLLIVLLCLGLVGCATTSPITLKLGLGMTKEEVLAKCGTPAQSGAMKGKDGTAYETFMYKKNTLFEGSSEGRFTTYIYFVDGKVVYYSGNPFPAPEEKTRNEK